MKSESLKPGWRWVKFGDVVRLSKARSQDPLADGIERYVGLEHLEPGDLRIRSWGNVADGVTFTSVFQPGQVLFGKRRAYQRKVAVADFSGVCSGDIYVLEWVVKECAVDPGLVADIERRIADLNEQIAADARLGKQFRIGHSYVTPAHRLEAGDTKKWFQQVVETEIGPLLDEYWFDAPDEAQKAIARLTQGW